MESIMFDSGSGWCLHCGEEVNGVEPDARKYTCESCGHPKVYGIEELLMMGLVSIK
jgi:Zn finger protein HypA/HybF involved in hydrogenase expression